MKTSWGKGVPEDDAEAVKWCRKAAEQGYGTVQGCLGGMYEDGGDSRQSCTLLKSRVSGSLMKL